MKKKQHRIFKIKIQEKKTGNIDIVYMGDNYKPFEAHLLDIINSFTDNWKYDNTPECKGRCLGRTLTVDFIEVAMAKDRYPSYGGPKLIYEEHYDKHVEEHNRKGNYDACKYLKDLNFEPLGIDFIRKLLKKNHVIL